MSGEGWITRRRVVLALVVVLLTPTAVAGVSHSTGGSSVAENRSASPPVDDLTIVASQGRQPEVADNPGGLEIINTTSKEQVWNHGDDRCMRYYDTDPIDNSTLLFTANCRVDDGANDRYTSANNRMRLAFEYDWREGEIQRLFRVPFDTHDLDRMGPHRYAVADISGQRAYVYNYTADDPIDETTFRGHPIRDSWGGDREWEFDFTDHYPESDGGDEGYDEDYTHLNDVDPVDGGDALLLSPRDFNRVMLVNRTTDEVTWTLGEQRDPTIIHGQHHPALLADDPPTLLVGDSLNHRIVEYERVDGRWELTWMYRGELNWPRAVARLPNGNTLITDSGNHRVVEVTPNKTVAWEYDTRHPNPYDAVRYAHGDEGGGPTMTELRDDDADETPDEAAVGEISLLDRYHRLAGFVLPAWVGKLEFVTLVGALVVLVGWTVSEAGLAVKRGLR